MTRYDKGHKLETRQRILDVAARQFRERGVAAAGLAGIMAEAGLTNGAFYVHFESKDDLVAAVLGEALARREEKLRERAAGGDGIKAVVADYLSRKHRDNPGNGCPTAAMVADVARQPAATREAFTTRIAPIIARIAAQLPMRSEAARHRRALAIYALMVGTLQLSRAVSDDDLSDEILDSGVAAASALAGES
jgi:TetR/AcrR family transcriptional regulator, transcriptional repressor for nem operon